MNKDALPQSPHEKATLLALLRDLTAWIEQLPTTTSCMSCQNYQAGWCGLDESAGKIPKDVVASGCEQWIFAPDSPPF